MNVMHDLFWRILLLQEWPKVCFVPSVKISDKSLVSSNYTVQEFIIRSSDVVLKTGLDLGRT